MAPNEAESSTTKAPFKLADDFATWYSGVPWTWNPEKAERNKFIPKTASPERNQSDKIEKMKSWLKSPRSDPKHDSQRPISGDLSSHISKTSNTSTEDKPHLLTVAPYFEVKISPKGGYGAFALQDIAAHTEILSETALLQATNVNILDRFEGLSKEDKDVFLLLASFDGLDSNRVVAIFKTNRFQLPGAECGIFPIASRFNHACLPLCTYHYDKKSGKLVLTTKSKDISKGQEITISYGLTGEELLWNWGFRCDCRLCSQARTFVGW